MSHPLRLGIFGGSFDPPHLGHLVAAEQALHTLGLDRLYWVPSGEPPHRPGGTHAPAALRLEMVEHAIRGNDGFEVWEGELGREGPSYSVDTARTLKAEVVGAHEWWLLIGVDQFRALGSWKNPDELARLVQFAVVARDGHEPEPQERFPHATVGMPRLDVSSTDIRSRRRKGETIRYLVPEGVRTVVDRENLYL